MFVYVGSSLVRSYSVPAENEGNIWTVFKLNPNGEFEDINSVTSANFNGTTLDVRDLATVIMPATDSFSSGFACDAKQWRYSTGKKI